MACNCGTPWTFPLTFLLSDGEELTEGIFNLHGRTIIDPSSEKLLKWVFVGTHYYQITLLS